MVPIIAKTPVTLSDLEKSLIEEAISDPLLDVFDEEEDIELKELTINNKL